MFHNWNLRVLLLPINKARKIYTARSAHSVLNLQNSSTTVCRLFFFAFKKKNYLTFYWGIIALQTFAVFCQASTWISHRYTYTPAFWTSLPSPFPSHPSRLLQSPCLSFLIHRVCVIRVCQLWICPSSAHVDNGRGCACVGAGEYSKSVLLLSFTVNLKLL